MIHIQQPDMASDMPLTRFYAWCACGVCSPLRLRREDAVADEGAHRGVCSAQVAA